MFRPASAGGPADRDSRGQGDHRSKERALAALARRQHGRIGNAQLKEIGFSQDQIDRKIAAGTLAIEHKTVYLFGAAGHGDHGRWRGALLACGDEAALSHRSAARLRRLRRVEEKLDVTVPRGGVHLRTRFKVHRPLVLDDRDVEVVDGFRVTTVAKTLVDLPAVVGEGAVERALREAASQRVFDLAAIQEVLSRHKGRRGVGVLKDLLARHFEWNVDVRERLEQAFRAFLVGRLMPPCVHNHLVEGWLCDVVWAPAKLVVELDSRAHHLGDPVAFEADRRRDAELAAAGWVVVRVTWRRLHDAPDEVERLLRRILRDRWPR